MTPQFTMKERSYELYDTTASHLALSYDVVDHAIVQEVVAGSVASKRPPQEYIPDVMTSHSHRVRRKPTCLGHTFLHKLVGSFPSSNITEQPNCKPSLR